MKRESTIALCLTLAGSLYASNGAAKTGGNVLVIVADDLGKEVLSIYDTPAPLKAKTPNIDRLAKRGVIFDNVWGSPLSAPVRAAMLTGRYGHHTGVVALDIPLPLAETTLFEALPKEYTNAVIGKWHLSNDFDFAPKYGIDHFAGIATEGGVRNYFGWRFTVDGVSTYSTEYVTTQITNSAKEWIAKQSSPWVCWVAYNAPHIPLHLPPKEMHSQKRLTGDAEDMAQNPIPYYLAMVESLDYDLGRLLEGIDDDTTIIFIGDNGSLRSLLQSPYSPRHGKGTLYESGVAIPMIVCGGDIAPTAKRSDAMVSAVDIFPSVMEFAGETMPKYGDGYSFASAAMGGETLRKYNFSEVMTPRKEYTNALSDGEYKLITTKSGSEEFYNIKKDPLESRNIILSSPCTTEKVALERLRGELACMLIPLDSLPESVPQARGGGQFGAGGNRGGGGGNGGWGGGQNRNTGGGNNRGNFTGGNNNSSRNQQR